MLLARVGRANGRARRQHRAERAGRVDDVRGDRRRRRRRRGSGSSDRDSGSPRPSRRARRRPAPRPTRCRRRTRRSSTREPSRRIRASRRSEPRGLRHRALGEPRQRCREVRPRSRRRLRGEQHEPRRHDVQREAGAGPVAERHLVRGLDVVEVHDLVAVEHRQARRLAGPRDELGEHRPGPRRRASADASTAPASARMPAPMPYVPASPIAHDRAERLERAEQARDRAHGQVDGARDVADAAGRARDLPQHGERPVDRLHRSQLAASSADLVRHLGLAAGDERRAAPRRSRRRSAAARTRRACRFQIALARCAASSPPSSSHCS